jgi:hypothetical protein
MEAKKGASYPIFFLSVVLLGGDGFTHKVSVGLRCQETESPISRTTAQVRFEVSLE